MFLTYLLEGKIQDDEELKQWLSHLGREIKGDFCIVAAKPYGGSSKKLLLPFIQRDIERIDTELHPVVYGDAIYFLIMDHKTSEDCRKKVSSVMKRLSLMELRFGISGRFSDIAKIKIYRDQAYFALHICLKRTDAIITYYSECALQQVFKTVSENLPSQSYIHPALSALEAYDHEHGSNYLATLSAYILSMCNIKETVNELHIHRNTLPYRLRVIEQIADIDLSQREIQVHLLVSLYMKQYIRQNRAS
jgi:sugar diacid utilization regulator